MFSETPRNPLTPNLRPMAAARWRALGLPKAFWDVKRYGQTYRSRPGHREKARTGAAKWREENPGRPRKQPGKYRKTAFVSDLKSKTPCADCKQIFPACCMDFDHLPGKEKLGGVSWMLSNRFTLLEIQQEILKCELVCANCHRIRTHVLRRSNKTLPRTSNCNVKHV